MTPLSTTTVIGMALWCAGLLMLLVWMDIGQIKPKADAHFISSGQLCVDAGCEVTMPIDLPWFSRVALDADVISVNLVFALPPSAPQRGQHALYFPKLADAVTLYINGTQIHSEAAPRRAWNTPLLVPFDAAVLASETATLEVALSGRLSEGLDLHPFYVGPRSNLYPSWALRTYLGPEFARLGMAAMIALGVALLLMWSTKAAETATLWLGLSCFCACIILAHYGLGNQFLSYKLWTGAWILAIGVYVYLILRFVTSLLQLRNHSVTRAFAITLAIGIGAVALAPVDYTFHLSFAVNFATAGFAFSVLCLIYANRQMISRVDFGVFFACLSIAMVLGLYGLVLHLSPAPPRSMHLFHFMPSVMALACLWLIVSRAMQSMRDQATMVKEQSRVIEERTRDLHRSFEQLADAQQQQAVTRERERIMSDLHDGIGGHLVSTLSYIRETGLQDETLVSALEDALRELALLVDSSGHDKDVVTLLGMLRLRLEGLLEKNGLKFDWRIEGDPNVDHLPGAPSLQIARIVQEAITNALKHADASVISVHADAKMIEVSDDGSGFDPYAMVPTGFGLRSMRQRAEQLGLKLEVSSSSDGTSVRLAMPFAERPESGPEH